jgi:uncharacterized protein YkwD
MRLRRSVIAAAAAAAALTASAAPAIAATPPWWGLYVAINKARVARGLLPMGLSPGLRSAAKGHSADMLRRGYFAHTSPTGSTFTYRIRAAGFVTVGQWWAGETLAWGSGVVGDPRSIVQMWLKSPEHRSILLSPLYHLLGVGRVSGTFMGHPGATVWTVDWGHR